MIAYRSVDSRYPFLWEGPGQPPARWHDAGEGPVQYLSDNPDGAWAEFLRHEGIRDPNELAGVARAIWAVRVDPIEELPVAALDAKALIGGERTYGACRGEARRLRQKGARGLVAPSAALKEGAGAGWRVDGGLRPGPASQARTVVLFGERPDLVGWSVADQAAPREDVLAQVRHF